MIRYVAGLLGAFFVFGAALAIVLTSYLVITSRPVRFGSVLDTSFQLGLLGTGGIAVVVGPTVAVLQHFSRRRPSMTAAAFSGALLGPVLLIALWLLIRERDETFAALLHFWMRLPAEFIVGVVPHAAASAFFAGWLVAGSQRPRSLPDTTPPLQPTSGGGPTMPGGGAVDRDARG
jgi:hypothetical protein